MVVVVVVAAAAGVVVVVVVVDRNHLTQPTCPTSQQSHTETKPAHMYKYMHICACMYACMYELYIMYR